MDTLKVFNDLRLPGFFTTNNNGIERGFNVGGTAEQHYDSAIAMSLRYWVEADYQSLFRLTDYSLAYNP